MAMARFVTHLRYLYARVADQKQHRDDGPVLINATYAPEVEATATLVRAVLEQDTGPLTQAELSYLHLHLARLNAGHRDRGASLSSPRETGCVPHMVFPRVEVIRRGVGSRPGWVASGGLVLRGGGSYGRRGG